ncbi:YciI family protein [Hydrogenophaga sp.]|uniref:YciI family protein n=1 Tax=Hydrogenophaga sp. TaxID=1904254 RepID=UPI002FCB8F1C
MFVVLLNLSTHKDQAPRHMEAHKAWLQRGFDDGVFLVAGSQAHGKGGAIVAHNTSRAELEARVAGDPFVVEDVVKTEFIEMSPSRVDERLRFLLA